jgi:hypothetical protein
MFFIKNQFGGPGFGRRLSQFFAHSSPRDSAPSPRPLPRLPPLPLLEPLSPARGGQAG